MLIDDGYRSQMPPLENSFPQSISSKETAVFSRDGDVGGTKRYEEPQKGRAVNTIEETADGLYVNVEVRSPQGLHARPAGRLVAEAKQFEAELTVCTPTEQADAKSILDILSLAIPHGARLKVHGKGLDARRALERLACLFETDLRE